MKLGSFETNFTRNGSTISVVLTMMGAKCRKIKTFDHNFKSTVCMLLITLLVNDLTFYVYFYVYVTSSLHAGEHFKYDT